MSAKYWIKLYHEILYDPKMARMNNDLWRRTIELFLLAGETDIDGSLPNLGDIAWKLRINPEQLESEMVELQKVGIISMINGGYCVTKFAERQQPMTKAEYMQRKRNEDQKQEYYQPVTVSYQPVTNGNAEPEEIRGEKIRGESSPTMSSFDLLRDTAIQLTGLQFLQGDIKTLIEWDKEQVTEDDIRDALQWRKDQGLQPAKTISQLAGGVATSRSRRVQDQSARKNGGPKEDYSDLSTVSLD